jgi:EAL domain-containing protein (putative c-di-GMP-specific phosphodiesterase class I)
VGLVIPEQPYEQMDDILRDADIAMYRAKQAGGGRVVTFSQEMYLGTVSRMKLESDLRTAVERREFAVVYQPIVALHDNRVTGFEALVRWNHPERGLLLPGDFIQEAEEIGAIIPIGYFVLEEACRTMQAWRAKLELPFDLIVSVNLSAKQMMAPDLIPVIQSILQKTAFEPNRLWFEITESTLLRSDESVVTRLNELRAMGIRIEIDDFGTGYSSLSYLQNLPVDGIKIDRSFVTEINPGRQSILSTLVNLAHNLGLVEIAEGVETAQQRDFLVQTECQFAQGYLIARPMPSSDIETLLKAIRADAALLQTGQNACEAPPA